MNAGTTKVKLLVSSYKENEESKLLRQSIRDRIKGEISLNAALFPLVNPNSGLSHEVFIQNLQTIALEEITSYPFPESKILKNTPAEEVMSLLLNSKNKNHFNWAENITSEIELLERIHLRIKVSKLRVEEGVGTGDVEYLQYLLTAAKLSLK